MDENSFFSIDKLVEFGMSMAVATQMANSMNLGLQSMQIPGARNPIQPDDQQLLYYAVIDGQAAGPFSATELSHLVKEKRITNETYVWKPGMQDWQIAETVPDILKLVALAPPPIPATE